ncbi:Mitochondrial brown fat uncoupling protein 1 (UCP 1) (Solute carrier family 25 member 7) (Thermogenin) [Durusdinium trenchii]|uniref:Mitochondrial brown fat uncoupling protein 1 (UCP 1) (Solute carrier family 25 member 7) (Thermogenin) n=1 Tax=Durusdinium trenchii TaxID=1381693 RepID=A0ABP0RTC6_9DINO
MLSKSLQDLGGNTLAAAVAGCCQPAIFNPMDCLRIRWQVAGSPDQRSFRRFALHVVRSEGLWKGLWRPGLPTNMCAVAVSQGLRMGLYPTARDVLQFATGHREKSSTAMLGAGLTAGSLAYFVGAPFWLVKTRQQAQRQFAAEGRALLEIFPAKFGPAYWQGCSPLIARGALLTAGQMFGYDGTKTTARRCGLQDDPMLHVAAAACAGFSAATLSAPADVVMTRYQSSSGQTLLRCAGHVLEEGGPAGFFRGWTANFFRLAPTFTVGSLIYEQCRLLLGLGYMT